jgi:hypothetical protein
MLRIKLIAEDQAEGGHGFSLRVRRQRSEQYLTSSQTFAHFLRQKYGRPQQLQILLGSSDFLGIAIRVPESFGLSDFRRTSLCPSRCVYLGRVPAPA